MDEGSSRWRLPGQVWVTPAAVVRASSAAAGAREASLEGFVVLFFWMDGMSISGGPDLGPCLSLGGTTRESVPTEALHRAADAEFAVSIPDDIWKASASQIIDVDERTPTGLIFR